jgi:hypothetical protein
MDNVPAGLEGKAAVKVLVDQAVKVPADQADPVGLAVLLDSRRDSSRAA